MRDVYVQIKKYIKLYFLFFKNCIIAEMEFRINFVIGIFVECAWLVSKVMYAIILYKSGTTINGYEPSDMLIFVGMHTIMTGILISLFWPNYNRLTQYVKEGTLDMFIVKPISLQFMVTLRYMSFGILIPNIIGGIAMLVVGIQKSNITINIGTICGFIFFLISGTIVSYAIFLLPQMLVFKVVEMGSINAIAGQLQEVNNVPVILYPKFIQRIGIYIFPIFLISNFFPLFVLNTMDINYYIWATICPILLLILTRALWNKVICNYTSASS